MSKPLRIFGLVSFLFLAPFLDSAEITATVYCRPIQDAFVGSGTPYTNYGAGPGKPFNALLLGYNSGEPAVPARGTCYIFIKFDLAPVPRRAAITSAKLRMYLLGWDHPTDGQYPVPITAFRVNQAWSEESITFSNRPTNLTEIAAELFPVEDSQGWSLDITSPAQDWLTNAEPNHGIMLKKSDVRSDTELTFCSKEWSSYPSYLREYCLEVTYTRPDDRKADFNGDGREDILWRNYGPGGSNVVWFLGDQGGVSSASPEAPTILGSTGLGAVSDLDLKVVGIGDFNGDGKADILWRRNAGKGEISVWYMDGVNLVGSAGLGAEKDLSWQIAGTGDFNGDGKADILWRRNAGKGEISVWYMDGDRMVGSAGLGAESDPSWQIAGTGDFNGDGKVDILWRRSAGKGEISVWFMDGDKMLGSAGLGAMSDLHWEIAGAGDFNGDGRTDILWRFNGSGGANAIWYMDGVTLLKSVGLPPVADAKWKIVNH